MRDPRRLRLASLAPSLRVALVALGLVSLGFALGAGAEQPTIYKWVDANGVAHYTTDRNRIPSSIRDRIEQRAPASAVAPAPAAPADQTALAPAPALAMPAAAPAPAQAIAPSAAVPAVAAPAAATSAVPGGSSGASDLARDAVPVASPPPATRGVAVAAPPPFYAEPGEPAAPKPAADAPRQPAPNVPATIESEGVAPEPTEARTRTATAELGPRTPADPVQLAELDRQITDLEAKVAEDEDSLTTLISVPDQQRKGPLVDDPKFREIAKRLPKLQADLQALRERRGKYELAPAPSQ